MFNIKSTVVLVKKKKERKKEKAAIRFERTLSTYLQVCQTQERLVENHDPRGTDE